MASLVTNPSDIRSPMPAPDWPIEFNLDWFDDLKAYADNPETVAPSGLPDTPAFSRYVGATTAGMPSAGTFGAGDWFIMKTSFVGACIVICRTGGTIGGSPVPVFDTIYNTIGISAMIAAAINAMSTLATGDSGKLALGQVGTVTTVDPSKLSYELDVVPLVSAAYTCAANQYVPIQPGVAFNVDLPISPADNTLVIAHRIGGASNLALFRCNPSGTDKFQSSAGPTQYTFDVNGKWYEARFRSSGKIWYVRSGTQV